MSITTCSHDVIADLGLIPFYVGAQSRPTNPGLPDVLPFVIGVDRELNRVIQMPNATVQKHLVEAYRRTSQIGTPMAQTGLGRRYCDDFESFICKSQSASTLEGKKVLEIGCGTGYLLTRLKSAGADVVGIDPGGRSGRYAKEAGIPIIHAPFESRAFRRDFDLIVHYGVLEHVQEPDRFIRSQLDILKPGGSIVLAVPDCHELLLRGDLSIFAHEHWSYFTRDSLHALASTVGVEVIAYERAGVGGAIYTAWRAEKRCQDDFSTLRARPEAPGHKIIADGHSIDQIGRASCRESV